VSVEAYSEWIVLVADLTIVSLNSWQWAKDSVYYLLGLWSRCVGLGMLVVAGGVC
jgi:exportin-7